MVNESRNTFKTCMDNWNKLNDKGANCLSRQVLGQPSTELDDIVVGLREVLDVMFEKYAEIIHDLGLEEVIQEEDASNIPHDILNMRNCVDMYDQEFMVKECIRGTVCGEGFATKQHLSGCIALWKSETYLDEEVQEEIKKHF